METPWIFSSTFLPCVGEPIEFLLEEREQPMHGTFANGAFHSRWADYDSSRVGSWRALQDAPSGSPTAAPAPTCGMMRGVVKLDLVIACVVCLALTAAVLIYFLISRANFSGALFALIVGANLLFPCAFLVWTSLHGGMSKSHAIAIFDS
ncbi:MAG: hypothetical protein ABIT64_05930 [Lysobacteraceae bacterium]